MKRIALLVYLARKGSVGEKVRVTMRELADVLGVSPQSVLRLLGEMEEEGLISRETEGKKTFVEVTEGGLSFLDGVCTSISEVIYSGFVLGEVVSGLGEGAYYVRQYAPLIEEYLGFKPYPGTLNVRVLFPRTLFDALSGVRPVVLPGFVKDGRTFGDVKVYRALVGGVDAAIVVPSRTVHPPGIAEIISHVNLREKLGLHDGSRIKIEVVRT